MPDTPYRRYLRSATWRRRRKAFRCRHAYRCICGETQRLQLHHKTYERLGKERDEDLMWLCQRCHTLVEQLVDEGALDRACAGFSSAERAEAYAREQQRRAVESEQDCQEHVIKPWDKHELRVKAA